ncbi:hypothetical protein SVIOM74S_03192 [Streptomyces violarus]
MCQRRPSPLATACGSGTVANRARKPSSCSTMSGAPRSPAYAASQASMAVRTGVKVLNRRASLARKARIRGQLGMAKASPKAFSKSAAGARSQCSRPATAPARCVCTALWPRSGPRVAEAVMRAAHSLAATTAVSRDSPSSRRV